MRKKRATILFGSLLLLVAGYVTWCARPFYMKPPINTLKSAGNPADEAMMANLINGWRRDTDRFSPAEFDPGVLWRGLLRPWQYQGEPAYVTGLHSGRVSLNGEPVPDHINWYGCTVMAPRKHESCSVSFLLRDGKWVPKVMLGRIGVFGIRMKN